MAHQKEDAGKETSWVARVIGFTGGGRWLIYLSMVLSALSSLCSFVPFIAVYLVVADVVAIYPDFAALDAARMAGFGWMAIAGVVGNIGLYLAALLCAHSAAFDAEYNLKLQMAEHLARIPLGRLEALGSGRVGKVMDESVGAIEGFLAHSLPDTVAAFTAPAAIAVLLFAFTTVLGWSQYGTRAVEYLFGEKSVKIYQVIFVLMIISGSVMTSTLAWDISDTFNGLMMIPNLVGVLALCPLVMKITKNYVDRNIKGKDHSPLLSHHQHNN